MEWSNPVEDLDSVTITNRYGAIRIGGTSGELADIADFHGMAQYHADDPRKPVLVSQFEDGALSLEITYPNDAEVTDPPDSWRKRRTDITVYVDKNAHLNLETLHGAVVVRSYSGPINVRSESGDVQIKAEGPLQVMSKYGAVETFFQSANLPTPLALETVTGSIHLSLPWHASPHASLETRGEISSDYSIGIEWLPDSTLKRGSVDESHSAEPIILRSNQGNIRLLRRIDDRRPAPSETNAESLERSR
ncbi:MAG: hypothetical protein MPN21_05270 [Thermoanaerobaculia bacterium]|nr:hypothetical protein [Thermoanaerobaculia bacterium]